MKRALWTLLLIGGLQQVQAQIVSFNFTAGAVSVDGWTNVSGDPSTAVRSATGGGITVSSIATTNWFGDGGVCALNGLGAYPGAYFPYNVMSNAWFQNNGPTYNLALYNAAVPQLQLSSLNPDSNYIIRISASNSYQPGPAQYIVAGATVAGSQDLDTYYNLTQGVTFQHVYPDGSGNIKVYVNGTATSQFAVISGLQVFPGSASVGTPAVTLTTPNNGTIFSEGVNVTMAATASETGGTITKVEFYADTIKIGEVDTAPYNFTWTDPAPGSYLITAKATDNVGTINTSSVNIAVESLNDFWSTTGNIAVNSDSFFLGTVDTSRLVFRTKNINRMAIDSNGNVNIPLTHPSAFSIGGTVNDPVSRPAFRAYDNGDLTAGTTMDSSTNTTGQTGLRYYSKLGLLQVGATDRIDTTVSVNPSWPGGGIVINSKNANHIKGRIIDSYVGGNSYTIDSAVNFEESILTGQNTQLKANCDDCLISGYGQWVNATMSNSVLTGNGNLINYPTDGLIVDGFVNITKDTSYESIVNGGFNQFGGIGQLVSGSYLVNRTPDGTTLGSSNVNFTTLPYTGRRGMAVPGIAGYPLFTLGNGAANDSSIRSNAITVLFNGRTQINTAGHTNTLAQTDVTPKAALEVVSTNSGVLLPKLTNAQRNAIASGDLQNGLLLYNTDSSAFQFYNGSAWTSVGSGSGGGSGRWQFANGVQYDSVDNIAIGTSNPQGYKLAVNGTAIFTKIWVKAANNWPDYVFKKKYELMDLAELERYVKAHKHLPGITPESDVKREGINLGDQQAAVLKKVEELTLYLIDENKKLKEQNKQLEQQNDRLEQQQREIDELKKMIKGTK
jgi:hypothetical protein